MQYLYNAFNILAEYRDGEDVPVQYVSGPRIDEILYRIEPDGERQYYIRDGSNSVRMVVNEEGKIVEKYDYDAFGAIQGEIKGNRTIFAFTGREFDQETGLYYYRARYYQPEIGRFLSPDPLGMIDGPNLYVYVGNNPINYIDPFGLSKIEEWIAKAALILGKLMYKVAPLPLFNPDMADIVGKTNPALIALALILYPTSTSMDADLPDNDGDGFGLGVDPDDSNPNITPFIGPELDPLPDPGDLPDLDDLPDPEKDKDPCE